MAAPQFRGSKRRSALLKYLVEKAVAGEQPKEYAIGVDVFEKEPDYDPRLDPSVRVEVRRVRSKLEGYYAEEGRNDPIRIEIPKGSHAAVFRPVVEAVPMDFVRNGPRFWIAITGVVVAVGVLGWMALRGPELRSRINSVVVLPFANLTGDPSKEYLADGVTEQLTDFLAQIASLRVVARTSAFQFKGKRADVRDIGKRVSADAVIEGSVRLIDGKLRVTVQINRSADGYHILSRTFDCTTQDLGRIENEMVGPVVAVLRPGPPVAKRRTPDPQAHDLYLKARAYRGEGTQAAFDQAIICLRQAIERDPEYADAYAALSNVYAAGATNFSSEPAEYAKRAKAAATRALELDPSEAVAYAALGTVDSIVMLNWKVGEEELRHAIRLMPQGALAHNRLGMLLMAEGRFPEAIRELRLAENLDPLVAAPGATVGLALYMSRDFEGALRQFTRVRDLHPDTAVIHGFLGLVWEAKHDFGRAMTEYQTLAAKQPHSARPYLALLFAESGHQAEAREMLAKIEHPDDEEPPSAFDIAAIYGALGDKDSAFRWLDRAYENRQIWFVKIHPALEPLRRDPRYRALLRKCGLAN